MILSGLGVARIDKISLEGKGVNFAVNTEK